jgi:RimJ/RimL family protein N-acetyltransferase
LRREANFIENEYVKGEWTDELVYAILAPEWRALYGAAKEFEFRD